MTNCIYIYYLRPNIIEGGMARNKAFKEYFLGRKGVEPFNVFARNKLIRIMYLIKFCYLALILKNKNVFIHQGALLYLYPIEKLFKFSIFTTFIKVVLSLLDKRNHLTVEVNDLPYEQALDLRLEVNKKSYQLFEEVLYRLKNAKYIFAAKGMGDYCIDKFNIPSEKVSFIINGSPKLIIPDNIQTKEVQQLQNHIIRYVYCGTLNKGRDIEELIDVFKGTVHELYLVGAKGEWLKSFLTSINNVKFLGEFDEDEAHKIISKFDVGIIHYDESKLYYNICYPTKASFYITAGLPVLCTPLKEMKHHFSDTFIFSPLKEFPEILEVIDLNLIQEMKKAVNCKVEMCLWNNALRELNI